MIYINREKQQFLKEPDSIEVSNTDEAKYFAMGIILFYSKKWEKHYTTSFRMCCAPISLEAHFAFPKVLEHSYRACNMSL